MSEQANYEKSEIEALRARNKALGEQLEHDRTLVAVCVSAVKDEVNGRYWLTEGRGPYEWNDDNWHGEFKAAAVAILNAIKPMVKVAADWSNCPDAKDVADARVNLKSKIEALRNALTVARKFVAYELEIRRNSFCVGDDLREDALPAEREYPEDAETTLRVIEAALALQS